MAMVVGQGHFVVLRERYSNSASGLRVCGLGLRVGVARGLRGMRWQDGIVVQRTTGLTTLNGVGTLFGGGY